MHGRIYAVALLLAAPLSALAAPNYDYIQADWIGSGDFELDEEEADYDGWGLEGSTSFGSSSFLLARYSTVDVDRIDLDIDRWSLGLGGHIGSERVDLYGVVSYERIEFDLDGPPGVAADDDGDGYGLTGGFRIRPAYWVEIDPSVGFVDYGDVGGDDLDGFTYSLQTTFYFTDPSWLAISLTYRGVDFSVEAEDVTPDPDFDLSDEIVASLRVSF